MRFSRRDRHGPRARSLGEPLRKAALARPRAAKNNQVFGCHGVLGLQATAASLSRRGLSAFRRRREAGDIVQSKRLSFAASIIDLRGQRRLGSLVKIGEGRNVSTEWLLRLRGTIKRLSARPPAMAEARATLFWWAAILIWLAVGSLAFVVLLLLLSILGGFCEGALEQLAYGLRAAARAVQRSLLNLIESIDLSPPSAAA